MEQRTVLQESSVDDILASIRRMISDRDNLDDPDGPVPDRGGSDEVLLLTDAVAEGGSAAGGRRPSGAGAASASKPEAKHDKPEHVAPGAERLGGLDLDELEQAARKLEQAIHDAQKRRSDQAARSGPSAAESKEASRQDAPPARGSAARRPAVAEAIRSPETAATPQPAAEKPKSSSYPVIEVSYRLKPVSREGVGGSCGPDLATAADGSADGDDELCLLADEQFVDDADIERVVDLVPLPGDGLHAFAAQPPRSEDIWTYEDEDDDDARDSNLVSLVTAAVSDCAREELSRIAESAGQDHDERPRDDEADDDGVFQQALRDVVRSHVDQWLDDELADVIRDKVSQEIARLARH